jgi:hypothetical protein
MGQWIPERLREQPKQPDRVGPPPETVGEVAVEQIMRLLTLPELGPAHLILWSAAGEKLFEKEVPPPERKGKFAVRYGRDSKAHVEKLGFVPAAIELRAEGMSFVRHYHELPYIAPGDTFHFDLKIWIGSDDNPNPFKCPKPPKPEKVLENERAYLDDLYKYLSWDD